MAKIVIGADHAGVALKARIVARLEKKGYDVEDVGSHDPQSADDYPDFAKKVVKRVKQTKGKGILLCTTGTGMVIAANRHKGIRASLVYDQYTARMARHDNNANVLCLRSHGNTAAKLQLLIATWLKTPFSNLSRHKRRIRKLDT